MFINNFDPVALEIFSLEIRWYSLAYIFGIILGWILAKKLFIQDIDVKNKFDDYLTYLIIGIILGGRLGYIFIYNLSFYINNPLDIFKIWQGGMSFHGGLIGVIFASIFFAKKNNQNPFVYMDIVALVAPVGLFFGRIANFINSELYGTITNVPWAVTFVQVDNIPRHPSQLYEALLEGLFLFLLLIFFSFFYLTKGVISAEIDIYKKIDLFGEVLEKINKEYVDEFNQSESMDSAINGLLQSLDPYSSYMSPKIFDEMQTETSGEFGGLGIEVSMEAGVVKVISPIDDTPASRAGLKAGDYIVKINNVQVQGKSLSEAVDLMRGPVGSGIELTVRRRGEKKALTFNIIREVIQVQSVKSEIMDENIGYIRLTSFNDNSSDQIEKQIKKLKKNKNIKSFILDLRNNPGGLLTQAIKISDFFLENGEIVSTKSRKKFENRKWFAKKGDIIDGKTLLVLINYGSASASEIVAGALKDHKRAVIIGENSYGKGSVQSIIPLKNRGAIRLTVAKYYLPSGKSISEVGVRPDIEINEEGDDFRIKTDTDNQLNYAIKLLNG